MPRAVFLDRDGTVNIDKHYVCSPKEFELFEYAPKAMQLLKNMGFKVVVITNQSGVARGYFTEETLQAMHAKMRRQLRKHNVEIDGLYYCPHHPEAKKEEYRKDCYCRKPQPGLLEKAANDLQLDLGASFLIGDKMSDIEAGTRVDATTILVLTGHGREQVEEKDEWKVQPDHITEDMLKAVEWIKEQEKTR